MKTEMMLWLYEKLLANRLLEERLQKLYRQGKVIGGLFLSTGQEAISVGTAAALEPDDYIAPMIRNLGALLVRGVTPRDVIRQYMGRGTGPTGGRDGNTHFGDLSKGIIAPVSMLGASIPVMAGVALAMKLRGNRRVALAYIGDGSMSIGDFHEGMNFATVKRVPLIVIMENNGYAYSTPTSRQMTVKALADRAPAYGLPSITIDGNDILRVYETTRAAVEQARDGGGPSMIECVTFRMRGHAEHDDASYVPKELLEKWRAKDPLARFERVLVESNVIDAQAIERTRERIRDELEIEFAAVEPEPLPLPETALGGVYGTVKE